MQDVKLGGSRSGIEAGCSAVPGGANTSAGCASALHAPMQACSGSLTASQPMPSGCASALHMPPSCAGALRLPPIPPGCKAAVSGALQRVSQGAAALRVQAVDLLRRGRVMCMTLGAELRQRRRLRAAATKLQSDAIRSASREGEAPIRMAQKQLQGCIHHLWTKLHNPSRRACCARTAT